jgi:hypothetical protein
MLGSSAELLLLVSLLVLLGWHAAGAAACKHAGCWQLGSGCRPLNSLQTYTEMHTQTMQQ